MNTTENAAGWTDARVELLKKLWADGVSCSRCAATLGGGLTRNAVIGKARRLHLTPRKAGVGGGPKPRAFGHDGGIAFRVKHAIRRQKRTRTAAGGGPVIAPVDPFQDIPDDYVPPPEQRRTLLQLTSHTCRWPIGDPATADFYFCGGKTTTGVIGGGVNGLPIPYCAYHAGLAYLAPSERRPRGYVRGFSKYGALHHVNVLSAG